MTDAASRHIVWSNGGEASLISAAGSQIVVHSNKPFPPGAPVSGTLGSDEPKTFVVKIGGSRKIADAMWEVRGRLSTATTDVLNAFANAAQGPRDSS